jgi:hypothetical protein
MVTPKDREEITMSKTIEFGAFVNSASESRLREAQRAASTLGVTVSADGSNFGPSEAVQVTVTVPDHVVLTPEVVAQGRDQFDSLLQGDERLTDYAVVKDNGAVTQVVSLITGDVKAVQQAPVGRAASPDAAPTPAAPRRWSLSRALGR